MKNSDKTREQLLKEHGQDSAPSVTVDKRSQHLVRSIVIVAVVAALVVVGFAGFALYTEYRANIKAIEQSVESRVAVFHEHLKLAIGSLDAVMQAIADKIRVDDFSGESFHASLVRMKAELPILRVLLAVDEHGLIINESRDPYEARGTNIADRLYFRKHLEPDVRGVYIGPPVVSRIDGKWAMPISRAVRDEDGLFQGVAVASIRPYYFSELFTAMAFGPDYAGFLTHTDGTVLALFPYNDTRIGTSVANSELFSRHLPTAGQGVFQELDPPDGIARIVAYRLVDPWPLIVSFSIPKKDGLAPFYRFAVIWAIVIAFTLSVIIYAAHYQIGQTLRLAEQATTLQRTTDDLRVEINERKQAEESRKKSEAMFKGIFSQAPIGIELYDSKGNFINANQECLNIFGVGHVKEIKGFKLFEDPNVSAEAKTQLRNGEAIDYESEFDFDVVKKLKLYKTTKSGKCFLHVQITPYDISSRGNKGFVVHVQDITERQRTEDELTKHRKHLEKLVKERTKELEEKTKTLEKSQQALVFLTEDVNETSAELENVNKKLETSNKDLEAFAYSVSHDLRGPLRAISGFTRILMEDYVEKLDAEGKRLGGIIQQNTNKMGQLIDDLLTFSRMGRVSMSFSEIDMKKMANAIYHEATNAEARKGITFTIADLSKAEGDTNMMRQVWMNLISNAVKFSAHRKQAVISVTCQEEENKLTYCIKDDGAGFNMKYKDKLFGVFQRLHSEKEFEGTGVGLALVQRIIHRHNGEVWANGEVDNGAAFYFSLPKNRRI